MARIEQSQEERPQRSDCRDEVVDQEAQNDQPQVIVRKKHPSQLEFDLIKKQLEDANNIINEIPSLKEKISTLEEEKVNLTSELNRALANITTYKNNWRRSYRKVQSLRLTQGEMDPETVGEVTVRLMSESGLTEEQII